MVGGGLLLGRQREMAVLRGAFDSAEAGHGRLVLLEGDAGIGKTRLADALAAEARVRGARVLWGRCWEAGGAPAYWPWLQPIRAYLADASGSEVAEALGSSGPSVARIVTELGTTNPDEPGLAADDSEGSRFRIFDATSRFLRAIAAERPLVLVLDDLHAADEPSLRLLQFLAADISASRLLVIAIYREEAFDPGDPRSTLLADVARATGAERLSPRGLTEAEVFDYIEAVGEKAPQPGLAQSVFRETGGNPLFVGEVVRLLADEGRLHGDRDKLGRPLGVPAGVRAVIGRRLARLSEPCRDLLGRLSVYGEVQLDLLANLEERSSDELLELLDEAAASRVLQAPASPGGSWRFEHALIRDVLYAALPAAARIRLHRRTGETLEERYGGDREPPLAELAHHFAAAAVGAKAVDYASRAAARATRQAAHEEAVRLYRLALELGGLDDRTRCRLLLDLGQAATRAGDQATMREAFVAAAAIAERLGLAEELALAAVGYGGQLVHRRAGDDPLLIPLLEQALAAIPTDDSRVRVRLLARLAGALRDEPTMARRLAVSADAVAMARRLDDPVTLGFALQSRQSAIWGPDSLAEMARLLDEIEAVATVAGDRERLTETHHNRLVLLATIGADAETMHAEADAAERLSLSLRQPALSWYDVQWQMVEALNDGRVHDAEGLLQEVRRRGDRAVPWDADFAFRCGLFLVRREQGRLDEVAGQVRQAVVDFPGYRLLSCLSAYVEAATGSERAASHALLTIARNGFAFLPRDLGWPFGMMFLGETAILLHDGVRATEVEAALRPHHGLFGTASGSFPAGPVDRVLGRLAANGGRYDEALEDLDRAARACERVGTRLWAIRVDVDRAAVLVRRGLAGDRSLAADLLAPALASCRELGLVAIEGEARALLDEEARALLDELEMTQPKESGAAAPSTTSELMFRREGDSWAIGAGGAFRLHDSKGLRYLSILLRYPGRELHALDLLTGLRGAEGLASASDAISVGLRIGDAEVVETGIDPEARAAYRARLRELQADLDEAESFNDPERADRAREEIEALERELSVAFGLGGRARPSISPAERARQSVTKAIRDALRRIEAEDAAVGRHLARSVRTGLFCIYDPDPDAAPLWRL